MDSQASWTEKMLRRAPIFKKKYVLGNAFFVY
jgi:hypothetical protein